MEELEDTPLSEIPSLVSIYISELNLELGKEIAGVTKDAIELLQDFASESPPVY